MTHQGLGDIITGIGIVRYLSTCYDKVKVVCKEHNLKNAKMFYQDDNSITFHVIKKDGDISPKRGANINNFKNVTKDHAIYMTGNHNLSKNSYNEKKIPFSFYEQINLDPHLFWDYFHVPTIKESIDLYNQIKDKKYIFIHNNASNGEVFSVKYIEDHLKINKDEFLLVNPNKNCYSKDNSFYELAQKIIGHPLLNYTEIIKQAEYNIMTDSSFMCLAFNLNIKTDNNYYYSRDNRDYDFIYSNKYKFKRNDRKQFINIKNI